jgi:tetratricopeptide (TPR) repeat protein
LKLDGLPLALSTAGTYLEHVTTTFAEYLRLYEASWLKLQRTSPTLSSYENRSLYTTWQVTFDRIREQNAASARLLELWAYFDKQDVWFGLLRHACNADDKSIQKLTEDELSYNEAVRLLCEYGLAHPEPSLSQVSRSIGYGVHSCVHSWTVSILNKEWDDSLARLALTCVASEVPSTNIDEWWLLQQRLLQHVALHKKFVLDSNMDIERMEWALHNLGNLYVDQGRLAEAEAMYDRALQGKEEALGAKHTSTLDTVNNLGLLYADQSRLAEAEAMYDRALQGYEEALGAKHTSTLDTVNNLGLLYADQSRLAEAEAMYDRALQGYEEALRPQLLPLYLPALNNLFSYGDLYARTDREDLAREMYSRVLAGYASVQGPASKWCREVKNRLQRLEGASLKLGARQDERADIESPRSGPLKRKHSAILEGISI